MKHIVEQLEKASFRVISPPFNFLFIRNDRGGGGNSSKRALSFYYYYYYYYYLLLIFPFEIQLCHNTMQLVAVNLVDSNYCRDPSVFISAVLLSLSMMMRLEMPHINVLSKIDLIEKQGELGYFMNICAIIFYFPF